MATQDYGDRVEELFRNGQWDDARLVLEEARATDPANHWVLTQLGVTYYEEGKYEAALRWFLESFQIVEDCPLTIWNLAGTLDALGHNELAVRGYTWLLDSRATPEDDPCWESRAWTDSLKTDCVYRLGVCFERLGKKRKAEHCYRQYLKLLADGIEGLYSSEDVIGRIRALRSSGRGEVAERKSRNEAFAETLRGMGTERPGRVSTPLKFDELKRLVG